MPLNATNEGLRDKYKVIVVGGIGKVYGSKFWGIASVKVPMAT